MEFQRYSSESPRGNSRIPAKPDLIQTVTPNGWGLLFPEASAMRKPGSPASLLFRLIVPAAAAFVITILAMIAMVFGDERAPLAQVINRYGNAALVIEFAVVVVLALAAMTADRLATLRQLRSQSTATRAASGDDASSTETR